MASHNEDVDWENMSGKVAERFPALKESYDRELRWWGEEKPGQHIIYGDVFFPYIKKVAEAGSDDNEGELKRIFRFLEELANHSDERVQEVVCVTLCEDICGDEAVLQRTRKYMGNKTREFCDSITASKK